MRELREISRNQTMEVEDPSENPFLDINTSLYIYGGMTLTAITLTFCRSFTFFKSAMLSSKKLHEKMFHCLLMAPMKFFNFNPCGRILNRFSKDMGAIDEVLPKMLLDAIQVC